MKKLLFSTTMVLSLFTGTTNLHAQENKTASENVEIQQNVTAAEMVVYEGRDEKKQHLPDNSVYEQDGVMMKDGVMLKDGERQAPTVIRADGSRAAE